MNIIFLGAPGSGKGTYAKRVMEKFSIPHISTGDILRANIAKRTEIGIKMKEYMDKGQLVPDDVVIDMVKDRISQPDCVDGFIFDGFPRTIPQADSVGAFTKIDCVINLVVKDEVIVDRIAGRRMCVCGESYNISLLNGETMCAKCGKELYQREDDKPATVKSRLDVYYKQTAPLIQYYKSKGIVEDIEGGNCTIEEMSANVIKVLGKYDNRKK